MNDIVRTHNTDKNVSSFATFFWLKIANLLSPLM